VATLEHVHSGQRFFFRVEALPIAESRRYLMMAKKANNPSKKSITRDTALRPKSANKKASSRTSALKRTAARKTKSRAAGAAPSVGKVRKDSSKRTTATEQGSSTGILKRASTAVRAVVAGVTAGATTIFREKTQLRSKLKTSGQSRARSRRRNRVRKESTA
jgi:hypothetical protein